MVLLLVQLAYKGCEGTTHMGLTGVPHPFSSQEMAAWNISLRRATRLSRFKATSSGLNGIVSSRQRERMVGGRWACELCSLFPSRGQTRQPLS